MKQSVKALVWVLVLVLLLGGAYFAYNRLVQGRTPDSLVATPNPDDAAQTPAPEEDDRIAAPDFVLYDDQGKALSFSSFKGKPIVLNFWASWCPPCRSEMPHFHDLFLERGDAITFLMVNALGVRGETQQDAEDYLAEEGFTFPVYYDTDQAGLNAYGITGFPTSIFIDAEGYVLGGYAQAIDEATLRQALDVLAPAD